MLDKINKKRTMHNYITFDKKNKLRVLTYSEKPVINLIGISFLTSSKEWVNQIFSSILTIKISALDVEGKEPYSEQSSLSFGAYITPHHKQPVLEVNKTFRITDSLSFHNLSNCNNWKIEIALSGLNFVEQESLRIEYMDTNYIRSRVDDWESRIKNLIKDISIWSKESGIFSIRSSRKFWMYEEMMKSFNVPMREIETIDILKNNKVIISLKPFSLWIMGANGRIDLLTAKGNFVLVDEAERFNPPIWKLYLTNDKRKSVDFSIDSLLRLLEV